jgi:translation initiation factor 3 subunit L
MADPTAFYEPEEDELLSSLAVPTYQTPLDTSYGEDEYRRLQEIEEHAYAQQGEADQRAQLELVPEDVKRVCCLGAFQGCE